MAPGVQEFKKYETPGAPGVEEFKKYQIPDAGPMCFRDAAKLAAVGHLRNALLMYCS